MRSSPILAGLAAAIAFLAGCTVGPDYRAPAASAPKAWVAPAGGGIGSGPARAAEWWKSFGDPELDSLVARAVQANPDLQAIEARLREARAIRDLTEADLAPTLDVVGGYTKERISRNQPLFGALPLPKNFPFQYSVYQAGFDASWEIDLFGSKRRAREAATAEWEGAADAARDAQVSLTAEVARTYLELRGAQRAEAIARTEIALARQEADLTESRLEAGFATDLDVAQAKALLATLEAGLPPRQTAVSRAIYGLAALLGREPGALLPELARAAPLPASPPEVPVGLPSDLLQRRPDVRGAERALAAATARIGEAKADWFPRVSLTGGDGMQSIAFGRWFEPGSNFWSIGPTLQWRALDFGRVKAEVRAQTAEQQAALAAYQEAALGALQDAENALVAYAKERNRRAALEAALGQTRRSQSLLESRYAEGSDSYLPVLAARRASLQAEDALAASDEAVAVDLAALYKALGGGWEP